MKKIFMVACMLTFAFMISAQGGQGGGGQRQGGGMMMRQMTPEQEAEYYATLKKDLNLNDKQVADFKKIDQSYRTKQTALREKYQNDPEKMREERTKLTTEQTAEIKKLLTADQFKKYEERQAAQRQRMGQGGGGGNRQN